MPRLSRADTFVSTWLQCTLANARKSKKSLGTLCATYRQMSNNVHGEDSAPPSVSQRPMNAVQAKYLKTLCARAGTRFDPTLSDADAVKLIEELQHVTGLKPKSILKDDQASG